MAVSFDKVASIYDATRWSGVPAHVMQNILSSLKAALKGCNLLLDAGTGTGRFAEYFVNEGFSVIGVDVSLMMMAQAREKGVRDLVRADAQHLPFRDQSFDGSIIIHVLHVVQDWVKAVHELGRVTRKLVVSEAGDVKGFSTRQRYLELRREMGYPLTRLAGGETDLRKFVQPKLVTSAGDYWTDVDADAEIGAFESRKSSVMWDLPGPIHQEIIRRLHVDYEGKMVKRHDIAEVVGWDPAALRKFRA